MADNGVLSLPERGTAPSPPSAGNTNIYVDTSGSFTIQDSSGSIIAIGKASGSEIILGTNDTKFITPKSLKDASIYGVTWGKVASSVLTRTDSSVGMAAFPGLDTEVVRNDFDTAEIYKDIVEWTDTLDNVFIQIPKFYIQKKDSTVCKSIRISKIKWDSSWYLPYCFWDFTEEEELDYVNVGKYTGYNNGGALESKTGKTSTVSQTLAAFSGFAIANNTGGLLGYQILDLHTVDMLQCLFYVEFATLNSQNIVAGFTAAGNAAQIDTGSCDAVVATTGGVTSLTAGTGGMIYRGVENLWGNIWQFVHGINIKADRQTYVCLNPASYAVDTFTSAYVTLSYANGASNGYSITMGYDSAYPFAQSPTVKGGDGTNYYGDYYFQDTGDRIARVGGNWNNAAAAGVSAWILDNASSSAGTYIGCRLLKKAL